MQRLWISQLARNRLTCNGSQAVGAVCVVWGMCCLSKGSIESPVVRTAMILEEKPMCRGAIASAVASVSGFILPGFANSLSEASAEIEREKPDLILVDLFSIGYDFKGLERFIARHSPIRLIAIDDRVNPSFARQAKDAGAKGYACKSFEIETFQATVATVAAGGEQFPAMPLLDARSGAAARLVGKLSPRQLEVLKCIAIGMGNQEIADTLGITLGTAKSHTHTILKLTGARNRTEAALIAGRFLVPKVDTE